MKVKRKTEIKRKIDFEAPFVSSVKKTGVRRNSKLDLNQLLAPFPKSCYIVQVSGESMIDENIYDGDYLIVNKEEKPKNDSIVIASLNGELLVKTYKIIEGEEYLFSANSKFLPIHIKPFWEFKIQGVVKHVIRDV